MSIQLLQNKSTIQPKKGHQIDKYIGPLHLQTKRRHGKGVYHYKNTFFQYEGEYVQGKKHGEGLLKMKDGTRIQAYFLNDEIQGSGKIIYPDGSSYTGQLHFGQKHGKGVYESLYEKYEGGYRQNRKQGEGVLQNRSKQQKYQGEFKHDKYHGKGTLKAYNYSYQGEFIQGFKQGSGVQVNYWRRVSEEDISSALKQAEEQIEIDNANNDKKMSLYEKCRNYDRYRYEGGFNNDKFDDQGVYESRCSRYRYEGVFLDGLPKNYPNEFRVYLSSSVKNIQNGQYNQGQKILIDQNVPVFQYEIGGDAKNIYVQCVYQGPQYLDENQPTEQQIEELIKNWQNQNKKNKNPPPMPDFRVPKMKKPQLLLIFEQTGRQITFCLEKQTGQKQYERLKIDYRKEIIMKRQENQKILQELKKSQQEDPKKKGSKKDPKTDNQLKVNLFQQKPSVKQQKLTIETINGVCCLDKFELPDDFPQGKFFLSIVSTFQDFGKVKPLRIQLNVKSKQAVAKKK